jgi:hypothetical protein
MFRRLRIRKWLVAGLGLAALVIPTTALAGSNSQALDGRSPDTKDFAALAAQPNLDPAIVGYLTRYGFTKSQIEKWAQPLATQAKPKLDPQIVGYLMRYGYTKSQIEAFARPLGSSTNVQSTPLDGRSPDTIDFAAQAHQPVVTVVRSPGFQWGDFGVGLSAALLVLVLLAMTRVISKDRSGRKPATSS